MPKVAITLFFFLTAFAVGFLYAKPEWDTFLTIREKTAQMQAINTEIDEIAQNGDELIRRISSISPERRSQLDMILPKGANAGEFLVNLENISKNRKMSYKQLNLTSPKLLGASVQGLDSGGALNAITTVSSTGQESTLQTTQSLPFAISFDGDYAATKAFLDDLEFNVRLMDPLHMRMQVTTQKNQQIFTVSYDGASYYK